MNSSNGLIRACQCLKGRRKLAAVIGVSASRLDHWLNRNVCIPLQYAIKIVQITKQEVTLYDFYSKEHSTYVEAIAALEKMFGISLNNRILPPEDTQSGYYSVKDYSNGSSAIIINTSDILIFCDAKNNVFIASLPKYNG